MMRPMRSTIRLKSIKDTKIDPGMERVCQLEKGL